MNVGTAGAIVVEEVATAGGAGLGAGAVVVEEVATVGGVGI